MRKRLIHLTALISLLAVVSPIRADLIGHWTLDETSGTAAADISGREHHGTYVNSPGLDILGVRGTGMDSSGGYMEADLGADLPIQAEERTVAVWVKPITAADAKFFSYGASVSGAGGEAFTFTVENVGGRDGVLFRHTGGNMFYPGIALAEWNHTAMRVSPGATLTNDVEVFINGENIPGSRNAGTDVSLITTDTPFWVGTWIGPATAFTGSLDDVYFYDHALSDAEILEVMEGEPWPYAFDPNPRDGAMLEATWTNLSWRAGDFAVTHDVYIGDSFDDVNDGAEGAFVGNLATTSLVLGFPGFPIPGGLVPATTYYWRIDEVNDADPNSPWKGDVWSFWIPPRTAYNSSPADGAMNVLPGVTLQWTAGFGAQLHQVYFGDNFDDVSNASGAVLLGDLTYAPDPLESGKTYYWRVDEFANGVTHKGDVWSFTTVPDLAVTNPNLMLWWTLDEAEGTTAVDWSGHGNHGVLTGGTPWTDGYQGTALIFEDDVIVEAAGYEGITGTAPRTCCAWIMVAPPATRNIMSWGQNVASQKWRMRVDATGGLRIEVNGGSNIGVTNIADGRWHHVAVTFEDDGSPDVLDTLLYVDGQLDAIAASTDEPIDTASGGVVRIGESPWHNQAFGGVIDDARLYNKVLTAEEIQRLMLGDTTQAGNPVPDRNAVVDIRDISSLSFSAGDGAASHDVYFGTDRDSLEFKGNQAGTSLSLASLVEFGGGDYYWRIDEVATDGAVTAGTIWKFTVPDYLIVEDFESYNDLAEDDPASNRIYLTWIDGFGTTTNGAIAGNLDVPLMAPGRNSAQAMPVSYDNAGKTSEVTKTLTSGKGWTVQGVTKMVVWFSGDAANAAERMFVALGNAVVYHPDDAATQDTGWNEWVIDLQEFANLGADLTNVGSITIGFGTRNAPVATGGTGTVEIDDIRLIQ